MVDVKNKIQRVVGCFCDILQERYTEKLIKDYARVYGMPEYGHIPKYDEQKLNMFENTLPFFENDLSYFVMSKFNMDKKVKLNTSLHDVEFEKIFINNFGQDVDSIIGNYEILLEIDENKAKVDLVVWRGALKEKYNVLNLDMNQMEFDR